MKHDTSEMSEGEFRSTIAPLPAEACSEIGADDYDSSAPEGAAIVSLFLAAVAVLAALGAAHVLAHFLSNA